MALSSKISPRFHCMSGIKRGTSVVEQSSDMDSRHKGLLSGREFRGRARNQEVKVLRQILRNPLEAKLQVAVLG